MIPCPFTVVSEDLSDLFDQAPISIERLHAMARWLTHESPVVSDAARIRAAKSLARIQERDDRWIALASEVYGLSERDLQHNVALGGDNVLLATLIDICRRRAIHSDKFVLVILLGELAEFDIRHTLPGPQHDFCALWNELVEEVGNRRSYSIRILHEIRQLYISLHEGTDAAPTAFSASTDRLDPILKRPSSYPLCNVASHRTDSTAPVHSPTVPLLAQHGDSSNALLHRSPSGNSNVARQAKQNSIAGPFLPSDPTTPSEVGDAPTATERALLVRTSSDPLDASPSGGVAAALQDTSPAAMFSHTPELEGTTQRNIVAISVSSSFNPLLPTSSVASVPAPTFPPPSHVPPFPKTESLAPFNSTTLSRPIGDTTFPRLRGSGLMNTAGVRFANAVLQLLVHSPPSWNLFKELGDMKGQRGAGGPEGGGGATPLVDAMVRFLEEFMFKEKEPPRMHRPLQQARKMPREDEQEKKELNAVNSFELTYLSDAMKEKKQLKDLLVRSTMMRISLQIVLTCCVKGGKNESAVEFLGLYLDALDEELVELHTYISTHKPASAPSRERFEGQSEVGAREHPVCYYLPLFTILNVADLWMDINRQVQSRRPSHAYSVGGPVRQFACQASPTPSPSKPGERSNSTSRSASPLSLSCIY